jgi:MoCo/4Fe-4S cofactor protein with predicted Tat translocation signal
VGVSASGSLSEPPPQPSAGVPGEGAEATAHAMANPEDITTPPPLDLSAVRRRLASQTGPTYWRSIEELAEDPRFQVALESEFPGEAGVWADDHSRRTFLKLMGASLALAGVYGCAKPPQEKIVPYVNPPEDVIPGKPLFFSSAMPLNGYAQGVVIESHEGRPTKIEGNPQHPAALGATNVFMQASVLDLYDPDRSKTVTFAGTDTTWGVFLTALRHRTDSSRGDGKGIRILTGTQTSPTFAAQLQEFQRLFPNAKWHTHEPVDRPHLSGRSSVLPGHVVYDFSKAGVILSLDSDWMWELPGSLRYARQFMDARRRVPGAKPQDHKMNRLYVIESALTITGSMADHRKALPPSQIEQAARAIAAGVGVASAQGASPPAALQQFITAIVDDLKNPLKDMPAGNRAAGGSTLVICGESQPPAVHALVHEMNVALGNVGKSVIYTEPVQVRGSHDLPELIDDMRSGAVEVLLILGPNPVYDGPGDLRSEFAQLLNKLSNARTEDGHWQNFTARLGSHFDETSFQCQWHLPESHYLEAWGDARAFDGTVSIIQPLILPLYQSLSICEFIEHALLGREDRSGYEIVRDYWRSQLPQNFQDNWNKWLKAGLIENTAAKTLDPGAKPASGASAAPAQNANASGEWELVFRPDYSVWDGRFANNPWLQECPRPFSKTVWDNAAILSWRSAEKLGVRDGDMVEVRLGGDHSGFVITLAAVVVPGTADGTAILQLGYHRTRAGHIGTGVGFDVYGMRLANHPHFISGASISKSNQTHFLVMTRSHHAMNALPGYRVPQEDGDLKPKAIRHPGLEEDQHDEMLAETSNRKLVRSGNLVDFLADEHWVTRLGGDVDLREKGLEPNGEKSKRHAGLLHLYPDAKQGNWNYAHGLQWAMQIDQTACIGCNACVVACQAENNIAVVGKEEVARQREMHWIRIDDWFGTQPGEHAKSEYGQTADPDAVNNPQVIHQPVTCMQCEQAPCELVCPVGATTHSVEGINEMTYNRCVGTRYCSNNCPYKVRRFNFFLFSDYWTPSRKLQYNPDVTVRSRGVMEKCNYCIQRINETRMEMEKTVVRLEERRDKAQQFGDAQQVEQINAQLKQQTKSIKDRLQVAWQQSCPTEAIIFGDKNDPESRVTQYQKDVLDYSLLTELTTLPRTRYWGRLRNPNPKLLGAQGGGHSSLPSSPLGGGEYTSALAASMSEKNVCSPDSTANKNVCPTVEVADVNVCPPHISPTGGTIA